MHSNSNSHAAQVIPRQEWPACALLSNHCTTLQVGPGLLILLNVPPWGAAPLVTGSPGGSRSRFRAHLVHRPINSPRHQRLQHHPTSPTSTIPNHFPRASKNCSRPSSSSGFLLRPQTSPYLPSLHLTGPTVYAVDNNPPQIDLAFPTPAPRPAYLCDHLDPANTHTPAVVLPSGPALTSISYIGAMGVLPQS